MVLAAIPAPRFVLEAIVDRPNLRKILCSAFVIDAGKLDRDTLLETVSFGGSLNTLPTVAMGFAFRFDEVADSLTATKAGKILVVAADGDDLATPEEAEIFSARIGAAKLVVLSNAGHWAMLEQPKRLNRIIDGWLS
jgi:pimeloyl-ACP methyl ester carboxylesterase